MDPVGREAVKRCWTLLMRDLDPTVAVLDFLLQHEEDTGMTFERYEQLHDLEPRHKMACQVLLHVVRHCKLYRFLEALDSERSHPHLASAVRQELDRVQNAPRTSPSTGEGGAEVTSGVRQRELPERRERRVTDLSVRELTETISGALVAHVTQLSKRSYQVNAEDGEGDEGNQGKQLRRDSGFATDVPLLRGPQRVAMVTWRKSSPLHKLCRRIQHIQFGKVSFSDREVNQICSMLRYNAAIRDDLDAKFMAAALNLQFGINDGRLGGLEEMEKFYPGTRNPQLSLVVLLTMKGHLSTVSGQTQEAHAYLDSARLASRTLDPCVETLYCLRTFACLKREIAFASEKEEDKRKLRDVLAHARDVISQTGVTEENGGTVMVINRQMARCYMGYHPWKNPPFKGRPSVWDLQSAEFALHQAEECMRAMGRQPVDDAIHCLASAAFCFLRNLPEKADEWLSKGREARVTYKNFHCDALRLRCWMREQGELTESRD